MIWTDLVSRLAADRLASRIWQLDTTAFAPAEAPADRHDAIRQRLGWLAAPEHATVRVPDVTAFARAARNQGLGDVYLLGMGGSSLSAEVLRDVPARRAAGCRLTVLDTTDERAVRDVTDTLVPARALFLVASKSGTTVEVGALERHFRAVMTSAAGNATGAHFVAITDPGTPLVAHAAQAGYRHTFLNPPDIGGRYSALSLFGLVPASLVGLDIAALLASGRRMADRCRPDDEENPGLRLGAFMAAEAAAGRDKLTLVLSAPFEPFGPWIEQLVAESTGKDDRGVLPIVGEPVGAPDDYGRDRAFVAVVGGDAGDVEPPLAALEAAGHPVFRIETSPDELGAEFFRWEFATAVAGAALGVNPFDEPDVRDAKRRTEAQLDERRRRGTFRLDPPFEPGSGFSRREHRPDGARPAQPGGYIALLDYLPADPARASRMASLRAALRRRTGLATTWGIGPRYLHSTGQYHKGGPNTGLFLLLTATDASATPVPGTDLTFSTLKQAQALGDFDALSSAGRAVVQYHIDDPLADYAGELDRVLASLA